MWISYLNRQSRAIRNLVLETTFGGDFCRDPSVVGLYIPGLSVRIINVSKRKRVKKETDT